LKPTEDRAEEDSLLDDATIEVYPESKIEGLEPHNQCIFDPDFPDQFLRAIVERHGRFFFNHSIRKVSGLKDYIWQSIRTLPSGCNLVGLLEAIFCCLLKRK